METKQKKTSENFKVTGISLTLSKKLREKYPQLTEADVKFESGKENELVGRLEKKLSKNHEQVIEILNKLQLEKV
jgi:hypothetical protein